MVPVTRVAADAIGRPAVAAAIGGLVMVTVVADRMTPPAGAIADRYSTLAAILIAATVLTTLVASHERLDRPGRLAAVVVLLATGMAWYSGRQWVHEKYFDYLVAQQKTDLELRSVELSGDIANFLRARAGRRRRRGRGRRHGNATKTPCFATSRRRRCCSRPSSARRCGRTREMFSLRGLTDRDLDAFYRRPSNAFQIGVVARRLAVLAHRLERT